MIFGAVLEGSKVLNASYVAECSYVALGFLRYVGSDGGKYILGNCFVGLIFC